MADVDPVQDVLDTSAELVAAEDRLAEAVAAVKLRRDAFRWAKAQHRAAVAVLKAEAVPSAPKPPPAAKPVKAPAPKPEKTEPARGLPRQLA